MSPRTTLSGAFVARLHAIDRAQQHHAVTALPLAVFKKFSQDNGGQLAGLISYYAFFSLFPLLLVLVTVLGLVLRGDATLQNQIVNSSLASFPIIGATIKSNVKSLRLEAEGRYPARYSWMRPPSRSCLRIAVADGRAGVGGGCRGSGGASSSARCGLWLL